MNPSTEKRDHHPGDVPLPRRRGLETRAVPRLGCRAERGTGGL